MTTLDSFADPVPPLTNAGAQPDFLCGASGCSAFLFKGKWQPFVLVV